MKKVSVFVTLLYIVSGIVGGVSLFLDCRGDVNGEFLVVIKSLEWIALLVMMLCMIYCIAIINLEGRKYSKVRKTLEEKINCIVMPYFKTVLLESKDLSTELDIKNICLSVISEKIDVDEYIENIDVDVNLECNMDLSKIISVEICIRLNCGYEYVRVNKKYVMFNNGEKLYIDEIKKDDEEKKRYFIGSML